MPNRGREEQQDVDRALHDKEGWSEYRRLVLSDLQELKSGMSEMRREVINLRVKSASWGFIAGTLGTILAAVMQHMLKH